VAYLRLMPELPDYRTQPSVSPEGEANAAARHSTWAKVNFDPITHAEPPAEGYGWDQLAEVDRDRMAARVIKESDLISFWLSWHRAGGFAQLERGGWDRSTIFRKIRRFRTYFGVHPDDASFPWLAPDFERAWKGDRQVALEWAFEHRNDTEQQPAAETRWRPTFALRSNPHALEPEDPFDHPRAGTDHPTEVE